MSSFVSSRMMPFKKSQLSGLRKHHLREFLFDENVYPEFSCRNLNYSAEYEFSQLENQMEEAKIAGGKRACNIKFAQNSNAFVDNVVILSYEQVQVVKQYYPERWKKMLVGCAKKLAQSISEQFGLFLMAIDFHCDEGHFSGSKFIENFHLHMTFFNFDFEKLIHPFRQLGKTALQKLQDLTFEAFKILGFTRGISKEVTSKEHKSKARYLRDENLQLNENNEYLSREIETKKDDYCKFIQDIDSTHKKYLEKKVELNELKRDCDKYRSLLDCKKNEVAQIENHRKYLCNQIDNYNVNMSKMKIDEEKISKKLENLELEFEEKSGIYNDIWKSRNPKVRSLMLLNEKQEKLLEDSNNEIQLLKERLSKNEELNHGNHTPSTIHDKTKTIYDY
ncbi:hypothetical protein [uncultured Vibrio sp.]|uniref:hypothetical protein n=1 Tax=uncultured Vibrio sp. TaxID=114054 RepID=UPI002600DE0D|nr:hypothetical protein [uncultured Vibrio sp.]